MMQRRIILASAAAVLCASVPFLRLVHQSYRRGEALAQLAGAGAWFATCDPATLVPKPVELNLLSQWIRGRMNCIVLSGIADADMVHFEELPDLIMLRLFDAKITDDGLKHLKGSNGLLELTISGDRITDGGLEHLKGCTSLKTLVLANTHVTDAGVEAFQRALPQVKVVRVTLNADGTRREE
jgi:hypothetical protein